LPQGSQRPWPEQVSADLPPFAGEWHALPDQQLGVCVLPQGSQRPWPEQVSADLPPFAGEWHALPDQQLGVCVLPQGSQKLLLQLVSPDQLLDGLVLQQVSLLPWKWRLDSSLPPAAVPSPHLSLLPYGLERPLGERFSDPAWGLSLDPCLGYVCICCSCAR
jgi:hypothetical protein